jgi:hypothetical protein
MSQVTGFAQVEELPLLGRHRKPDEDRQFRVTMVSDDAVLTVYRSAPSATDALWTFVIDTAWGMHPDPDFVDDVVDRLGVRVVSRPGMPDDVLTTSFDLIELDEGE